MSFKLKHAKYATKSIPRGETKCIGTRCKPESPYPLLG